MLCVLLWLFWVWPVTDAMVGEQPGLVELIGGSVLWVFVQLVLINEGVHTTSWPRRRQLLAQALALPVALVAVGAYLFGGHQAQRESIRVFDAYTHRFPSGFFTGSRIVERAGAYVTVCGDVRDADEGFCTEINVDAPRGEQVLGGYRFSYEDRGFELQAYAQDNGFDGSEWLIMDPYECFGNALMCSSVQ